jgi:predicted Zn-ribbon and HTH transcriptional regulator
MKKLQVTKDNIIIDDTIVLKRTKKALRDIVMNFWLDYADKFSEYFDKRMTLQKEVNQARYRLNSFKHKCKRCNFVWRSEKKHPVSCKKCKNINWDKDVTLYKHFCQKCKAEWESTVENPVLCKKCKNINWKKKEQAGKFEVAK